jgi:D-galactarolactone cycloisomerase
MKITRVEPILIAVPFEHGGPKPRRALGAWETMETLLVRVDTDSGITGWGEAFGLAVSPVTRTALTVLLAPLCIGRDPEDLELMPYLRRAIRNAGDSGPVRYALSGIDIALWDIAGKVREQPLHELIGGSKRERIPTYASLLPYGTVDLVQRNTNEAIERGYRHVKLHEHTVETVAAARLTAGASITLMLDTNCAWNIDEAISAAKALESYDLAWLEEPIYPQNDYDALAALRKKTTIPIAAGENVGSAGEVRRVAGLHALDILQPDMAKIGGLGEMREAIANAASAGMRVQPHSPFFGPAIIATLHLLATLDADALCERFYCELDASVVGNALEVLSDGTMMVPQLPGLGVTIDERVIERYRIA